MPLLAGPFSIRLVFALAGFLVVSTLYADADDDARRILAETGVRGGFVVQIGVGDGSLAAALRASPSFQVQALDRDEARVSAARESLLAAGRYGDVAVDRWNGKDLPYVDNFVNLLVSEEKLDVSQDELMRVLAPNGVAYLKNADGQWVKTVKPRPKNIDEWSHYLHDATGNAVAHDSVVAPPRHLQWVGSPRWSRHHDRMASMSACVSSAGRMFYIMDEGSRISIQLPSKWKLIARDAFNGTVLWKRDILDWQSHLWPLKSGPTQLTRRLVSTKDVVYATLSYNAPLTALDAATGDTIRTYQGTDATEEVIEVAGRLFLVVRKGKAELADYAPVNGRVGDQGLVNKEFFWNEEPRLVMALDAQTGKTLWAKQSRISPLTLAADQNRVFFHDGEKLIAVDQDTGEQAWETATVTRRNQFTFNFGPRLVIHDSVVLYAGGDGKMFAFDSASGKELWTAEHPNSGYQSPQDLMVMNGLVWCAPTTSGKDSGVFTGRDPKTGEVKQEFAPDIDTYWFHHRCYIAKATDNFLIPSRTGVEFVDPTKKHWDIHHWVRGGCLYGVMPCNGLTYTPPHDCACYPEAKLFGFNALAPAAPTRPIPREIPDEGRLEQGAAYKTALADAAPADSEDWPSFRHDASRSGAASSPIKPGLSQDWQITLGGRLTSPVVALGQVYVAQVDAHTLYALDEQTGKENWKFTAGGRIDSPPTIHRGRVVFGSVDGWVYCVQASDGQLVWRYRAAPVDRRTMAYEQLESLWPVHGSVLIREDTVYCVSGRSNFLDGGLRLLRLDLATGEKKSETVMDENNPETGNNMQEKLQILQMPVGLPDILSTDGKFLFMKSQKFDFEGNRIEVGPVSGDFVGQGSAQRGEGVHLFAPMGFLDDSWFHRSYWVFGRSFAGGHAGYYQAGRFAPSGQIMVQGDGYVYGYGRKPEYLRWTTTMEHQLFAADPTPPEIPPGNANANQAVADGSYAQFGKSDSLNPADSALTIEAWITSTKPNGVIAARGGPAEGFSLVLDSGRAAFMIRATGKLSTVTGGPRLIGGWHHVVGVLGADKKMRLFVDGVKVGEGQASSLITKDPAQGMEIGGDAGGSVGEYTTPNGFSGIIDEVRFYLAAVTDEAVQDRFKNGSEMHPDPRLVLPFDDGSARDMSLHRNDGTIEGGQLVEGKVGRAVQFSAKAGGKANNNDKAGNSLVKPKWTANLPIYVRAMVVSGRKLFVAGPLDMIDEEETFKQLSEKDQAVIELLKTQDQAIEGKFSGLLLAVNADSGEVEQTLELGALPAWDGMAGANGRLYLSTLDGRVICLAKE